MAAPGNETEATRQRINGILAGMDQKLAIQSGELERMRGMVAQLKREFGGLSSEAGQHEPATQSAHETIIHDCTIGGRHYVACGFLEVGETSVSGDIMLDRTEIKGTTDIDEAEWNHIVEHRQDFRRYYELYPYRLVTARRHPGFPEGLFYLGRHDEDRNEDAISIRGQWDKGYLVLRRYQ